MSISDTKVKHEWGPILVRVLEQEAGFQLWVELERVYKHVSFVLK